MASASRNGSQQQESSELTFRLLVLGDPRVGKTSLINRFIHDRFDETTAATLTGDAQTKSVMIGEERVLLQVWDCPQPEWTNDIFRAEARQCQGFLICYDVSSVASLRSVASWMGFIQTFGPPDCSIALVATKCDLEATHYVLAGHGDEVALRLRLFHFATSAKEGNVHRPFSFLAEDILQKQLEKEMEPIVFPDFHASAPRSSAASFSPAPGAQAVPPAATSAPPSSQLSSGFFSRVAHFFQTISAPPASDPIPIPSQAPSSSFTFPSSSGSSVSSVSPPALTELQSSSHFAPHKTSMSSSLQLPKPSKPCHSCRQAIHLADSCHVGDYNYHRLCLTCTTCQALIRPEDCQLVDEKAYCLVHSPENPSPERSRSPQLPPLEPFPSLSSSASSSFSSAFSPSVASSSSVSARPASGSHSSPTSPSSSFSATFSSSPPAMGFSSSPSSPLLPPSPHPSSSRFPASPPQINPLLTSSNETSPYFSSSPPSDANPFSSFSLDSQLIHSAAAPPASAGAAPHPGKCFLCAKTAYPSESIQVLNQTYHRQCFKCFLCQKKISGTTCHIVDERIYCYDHAPIGFSSSPPRSAKIVFPTTASGSPSPISTSPSDQQPLSSSEPSRSSDADTDWQQEKASLLAKMEEQDAVMKKLHEKLMQVQREAAKLAQQNSILTEERTVLQKQVSLLHQQISLLSSTPHSLE